MQYLDMEGLAPGQHVTTSVTDKTSLVHVWSGQWASRSMSFPPPDAVSSAGAECFAGQQALNPACSR